MGNHSNPHPIQQRGLAFARPKMVKNGCQQWTAKNKWSFHYLSEIFGHFPIYPSDSFTTTMIVNAVLKVYQSPF
jgi:hypothetical protein